MLLRLQKCFRKIYVGVETWVCTCGQKRYETGDCDKNRYNFYMKFILLIDTWQIIFIFLNDCSWCELFEYIWCLYCWITRNFTINEEGPNNGSTWPLKDFKLGLIRPRFQVLHKHLAAAFSFLWVDRIWQNVAFYMCRDIWTYFNTSIRYILLLNVIL